MGRFGDCPATLPSVRSPRLSGNPQAPSRFCFVVGSPEMSVHAAMRSADLAARGRPAPGSEIW